MKKKHLEIFGWILIGGFIGCLVCAAVAPLEPSQYKATFSATIAFGVVGTICLIISQKKTSPRKEFI